MKVAPLLVLALAGCGDDGGGGNADVLWLTPNGSEVRVKLSDAQPAPF